MGNYKVMNPHVDNTKLPRLYPEPQYEVKTRPPSYEGYGWKEKIRLRCREEELADQAMPMARRKCYDPAINFLSCTNREGMFWTVFNCQQDYHDVAICFEHQFNVQMDKRRRDIKRNKQDWWKKHYSEEGEVGRQANMKEL